jgi:hypothetical protein
LDFLGGPRSQQGHPKFSAGHLLLERLNIRTYPEEVLGDGGDGAGTVRADQSDG